MHTCYRWPCMAPNCGCPGVAQPMPAQYPPYRGWMCPKCGNVYSPQVSICFKCNFDVCGQEQAANRDGGQKSE